MTPSPIPTPGDWTVGVERLEYQHCPRCGATWYFARGFCPRCGAEPVRREAGGRGTVCATTVVARAPTGALAALAPYAVLLVDADEGFRFMCHGDASLRIGDAVRIGWRRFGDTLLPHASPQSEDEEPHR